MKFDDVLDEVEVLRRLVERDSKLGNYSTVEEGEPPEDTDTGDLEAEVLEEDTDDEQLEQIVANTPVENTEETNPYLTDAANPYQAEPTNIYGDNTEQPYQQTGNNQNNPAYWSNDPTASLPANNEQEQQKDWDY